MIFTNCCGHEFIGDSHSPIRPDGYCLHCGFHPEIESLKEEVGIYKANERLMQMRLDDLKEANKVLREAVEDHVLMYDHAPWCRPQEGLQCICMDRKYYREEASLERMKQALAKADEIMGEKK